MIAFAVNGERIPSASTTMGTPSRGHPVVEPGWEKGGGFCGC